MQQRTRNSPWGNDLNVGLQTVESKLETDLVVTLTSTAVGNVAVIKLGRRDAGSSVLLTRNPPYQRRTSYLGQ